MITDPTRCTAQTRSILDLIMTNSAHIAHSGTLEVSISDHEPVYVIRKKKTPKVPRVSFQCRTYVNYIKEDFQHDLLSYDWTYFYSRQCVDNLWAELESVIRSTADQHCPLKQFKERKVFRPWVTPKLLELLKERNELYKLAKSLNTNPSWKAVNRNLCNTAVKHAKDTYVKAQLVIHEKDPRKILESSKWHLVPSMHPTRFDQSHRPELWRIDG